MSHNKKHHFKIYQSIIQYTDPLNLIQSSMNLLQIYTLSWSRAGGVHEHYVKLIVTRFKVQA